MLEETAIDEDHGNMNIDLPEPNFPESTDEDQDDEQEEELLEEEIMGPEFQMSIDELIQLDLDETNADFHSIFAQTQEDHEEDIPPLNNEEDPIEITVENVKLEVDDIRIAEEFKEQLKTARLETSGLSEQDIFRLRNSEEGELDIDDPILRLSLDIFLAVSNASEQTYTDVRDALMRYHPSCEIYSHDKIKKVVRDLSGVDSMVINMCVNTCLAYTGPFADMDKCPHCGELRYDPLKPGQKAPRQQFHTIIPGFYFQALRRTPENSLMMQYRQKVTEVAIQELRATGQLQEYSDLFHGVDILEAIAEDRIRREDMVLMFSVDGAQLYQSKLSDCWVYIWMVLDYAPDVRYKKEHIIPGGVIPGPSKPKNLDSFLFPGLYHIAALQNEGGLWLWDALPKRKYQSRPFLALATADGPAMAMISGMVGHFGAYGCRLKCQQKGRRKEHGNHYYPACLKPLDQDVPGSNHDDINIYNVHPESLRETSQSGLDPRYRLSIPALFPADLMHLASFNITDLMVSLWRGTMSCDNNDDIRSWDFAVLRDSALWSLHGQEVAAATPYLPGSFDRPPRNPAEKINSGYKAVEYLNWIYGLAPGLLYGILPFHYWQHFCKLVYGIRSLHQRSITRGELEQAKQALAVFVDEFEKFYYQRKASRLHFCRQSLHALSHLADQVTRTGPPMYMTQFPMERMLGDLGSEIKQHTNPYANLSQRSVRRAQVNALKAMVPNLDPSRGLPYYPRGSLDLGDEYVLLRARDPRRREMPPDESRIIRSFFPGAAENWTPEIWRWARLRLPTGQIARSMWKESLKQQDKVRAARNVKIRQNGVVYFGEVQYYFRVKPYDHLEAITLAMVKLYSDPDSLLQDASYGTVLSVTWREENRLVAINVKEIEAVVGMVPHTQALDRAVHSGQVSHITKPGERFFVVQKLGLDVTYMAGITESITLHS
ncbi:hypothetical protein A0H81_01464 [Grifola frondosa]|uniref:Transposase family Tnp2 protein n=1 Tax=Grifola frondosa TaxID=5627 RepID=A0A1C7MQA0_GRIFR|nr:hypothetical protein A0H81_01464 [Grifola frondosa]